MTLPTLSPEQRTAALAKASESRLARAEFKREIASRSISALDALNKAHNDDILSRMRVIEFLRALPSIGVKTATRIMEELQITPGRRLRGLGPRQLDRLQETCTDIDSRH